MFKKIILVTNSIRKIIGKIKKIGKIFYFIANHAFLTIIVIFIIELIFGGFLFYRYALENNYNKVKTTNDIVKFEEARYQGIINFWKDKQLIFDEVLADKYANPFKEKVKSSKK